MKQKTVNHIKHEMYDADEARWMSKKRNTFNKRSSNRAERKNVKQVLENYEEYDMYNELDDLYDDSEW